MENKQQIMPCQVISMNKITGLCLILFLYIVALNLPYHDVVIQKPGPYQRSHKPL